MHHRNVPLLISLLLGSFLAAGMASGQEAPKVDAEARAPAARRTVSSVLRDSDANGDGMLQRDEAPILILSSFDEIDRDHDNQIDSFEAWEYDARVRREAESRRRPAQRAVTSTQAPRAIRTLVELVEFADTNGDEKLSQDEIPSSLRDQFEQFDLDGSGYLEHREAQKLDSQSRGSSDQPRQRSFVRIISLMDTDGDGLLQKKEAPLRVQRIFETLDRDGNGAIDAQEAQAADAAAGP